MAEEMVEAKVQQHAWTEFRRRGVTPIGVMEDGAPAVVSMQDAVVKIFCEQCGLGLTPESQDTGCPGVWPPDEED